MQCNAVSQRLVAWRDGELSPGERVRVSEHLRTCGPCRAREQVLASATPYPPLFLHPAVATRLRERTEIDVILTAADDPQRTPRFTDLSHPSWFSGEVEVPRWIALAAAFLLASALGWAWQSHTSLEEAHAELARRAADSAPAQAEPAQPLPADHYRPAAWQSSEDPTFR